MFERFSGRARRVVVLAQEEARLLGHNYIGTEHILLGLVHEREGVAGRALESLGVKLDRVRRQVEQTIGRGDSSPSHLPFTRRATKVLGVSLREAVQLGQTYIGTEHILLGLLREGEGVACQVLVKPGADLSQVRARVLKLVADDGAEGAAAPTPTLSTEFQAVIEEARGEAAAAGESEVAPIHMFLAAVQHPDGAAGRMLHVVGVDPVELRRQVIAEPDEPGDESSDQPGDKSG